jgi:CRISPR/Cas system-associated exonuclease Cas4 (RecB family)
MFPIVVNDGQTEFPDADIYYIVCKEGVYLKKRLGVMESTANYKLF